MKRFTLLALVAVLAACSDDPVQPVRLPPISKSVVDNPLIPNSIHYRAAHYTSGHGRAGDATLSARALLGKDGKTDFDVSTGDVDAGINGTQNITKLQIKTFGMGGELQSVQNINNSNDIAAHLNFADRPRHSKIQVQANIRAGSRNGVITLLETVNLRPDLAVLSVGAPAHVAANLPFAVTATVQELNHDLSATANCVLYIDDAVADHADGIWVAEGDVVNCSFTPTIADAGTHQLRVAVENVNPGDYDLSNNSASASVEVGVPTRELHGDLWVNRSTEHLEFIDQGNYSYTDASGTHTAAWDTTHVYNQNSLSAGFYASIATPISLPLTTVHIGQAGSTFDVTNVPAGCSDWNDGNVETYICVTTSSLSLVSQRLSGTVLYLSERQYWYNDCFNGVCTGASYPKESQFVYRVMGDGSVQPPGGQIYVYDVRIEDGTQAFVTNQAAALDAGTLSQLGYWLTCGPYLGGRRCTEDVHTYFVRHAQFTF